MKKAILFSLMIFLVSAGLHSQQLVANRLVGTWDQNIKKHAATIIFVDAEHVKFSYKGRTGTSKTYYYLLNNAKSPSLLMVDYKSNHKKHRNEYLIQLVDNDTIKLQVLNKHDSRDHFDNAKPERIITLLRRMG
jgi:hypothetical protein